MPAASKLCAAYSLLCGGLHVRQDVDSVERHARYATAPLDEESASESVVVYQ